jgi:mono/diheme cytochrome c family protein
MEMMKSRRRRGTILAAVAASAFVVGVSGCGDDLKGAHADVVHGKQLFVERCGACHTLSRAQTRGTVGPNLDAAFSESLSEGFGRDTVEGVVHEQILFPGSRMPARVVTGDDAKDVAAYVAESVGKRGQDTGALATAVRSATQTSARETSGRLEIDANPDGQLAYTVRDATATAGPIQIDSRNASSIPHDIAIQQGTDGPQVGQGRVVSRGGVSTVSATLRPGRYTFYCTIPGHREAGMQGTITVR